MRFRKLAGSVFATAAVVGLGTASPASATDNIKAFGEQIRVVDWTGAPTIGYTVTDFGPSSDPVGHDGRLYAATLAVTAFATAANPMISRFNARAENGDGYPLIADAPGALGSGTVAPGDSATGKLYFDVVGDVPNSVVYNDGMRDILAWIPGDPVAGNRP